MQDRSFGTTSFEAIAAGIPPVDNFVQSNIESADLGPLPLFHTARITVSGNPVASPNGVHFYDEHVMFGTNGHQVLQAETRVVETSLPEAAGAPVEVTPTSKAARRKAKQEGTLAAMLSEIDEALRNGPVETRSGLTGVVHMRQRLANRRPI